MTKRIVLLGKQGAGKGTQATRLSLHYKVPHISTGDVFRAAVSSGTELGYRVKQVIDGGNLVSDELTNELVRERLSLSDVVPGFIVDGYPRNATQATVFSEILAPEDIDMAIDIDVPTDVAIQRLASRRICKNCATIYGAENIPRNPLVCDNCGGEVTQREDDKPDSIAKRLALYQEQTAPLIRWYEQRGQLFIVDGLGTADEVFNKLTSCIERYMNSNAL